MIRIDGFRKPQSLTVSVPAPPAAPDAELRALLARARRAWRLRVALRGLAIVLASALGILVVSSWALDRWQYGDAAVTTVRVLAWVAIVALLARWVAVPLLRRVPMERVALYLEEQDPTLDAALVSAVEGAGIGSGSGNRVGEPGRRTGIWNRILQPDSGIRLPDRNPAPVTRPAHSPSLTRQLLVDALARARAVEARRPERRRLQRASAMAATVAVAGVALVLLGPAALRQSVRLLAFPWREAAAAEVYAVAVEPGNVRLAKGGDQEIRARLRGFLTEDAELAVRRGATGAWERIPMGAGADSGQFVARLFDVDEQTQYFVEANGVRSPVFTLEVANLPAVRRVDLEYRYPAYTGMAPQRVEDGGDIAAIAGTVVRVRATSTMAVQGGRIVLDDGSTIPMRADSAGTLAGELRVAKAGFYRIELQALDGEMVRASLDYAIDVLDDNAPTVTFRAPGRDMKVTSLEEVFAEVVAEDDYGVQAVELVFTVNGGAEQKVALHGGRARKDVTAGHTFYLEELELKPGDLVAYFARARDASRTSATDMYFMEVKPFDRAYRQSEQAGGQPGQPGEEEESEKPSALAQRQREIVAATFKVVRDSAGTAAGQRREHVSTITLSQGQLRERVERLARRMATVGASQGDSTLDVVAEELPKAAAAMKEAEELLGRGRASQALAPEQRALQHLQRAEAAFREIQLQRSQQGQGGGGQQQESDAEQLADLFEMDVDKMRNQYESVDRGGRSEQSDRKVDETLERLRALAQRQQQENERARRRAEAMQGGAGGGGGGQSQRQLAEETAEAARQLERLARERQSEELAESARRLQDAASAMKRSAASGREGGQAEAAAALDRLQDARRLLDQERGSRLQQDAQQAAREAQALAERQRQMAEEVGRMRNGTPDPTTMNRLTQQKEQLARDVEQLEGRLDRLSRDARRDEREAARKLQEAAGEIRERRIPDKVRYSRGTMRAGSPEYARSFEEQIGGDLEELRKQVTDAVGTMGQSGDRRGTEALDRARDIARGLESLRDRSEAQREGGAQGARNAPSPQQSQGQSGQQGRNGQNPTGQPGQQGQQGQGGRGGENPTGQAQGGAPGQMGGNGRGAAIGGAREAMTPEQIRQLAREYRERRMGVETLRRELAGTGADVGELDRLLRQMRALEDARTWQDGAEVARLQAQVTDGFKEFEFALRRRLAADEGSRPVLGGANEVSPRYRALVEEYYRSLGRGRP